MGKLIDLTGKKFGRLTVLKRAYNKKQENGKSVIYWECVCDCGNKRIVSGHSLRSGGSKSCGCLHKEIVKERMNKFNEKLKKKNKCYIDDDTVTVYARGGIMLCDKSDWEQFSDNWWFIAKDGYATTYRNGRYIKFHVLIMDCPEGYERDHINGNRADNRRINLRVIPASANRFNKGLSRRNKSGYPGVFWYEARKKYQVSIGVNGKQIHIGYFSNYDEAVKAKIAAEEKYFGEYRRKLKE